MYSVFQEIEKVRGGNSFQTIETLFNRYAIYCQENSKIKTAYCFSVPIRNIKNSNLVDLRFYHNNNSSTFVGSEAKITVSDRIRLSNDFGVCDIIFQGSLFKRTNEAIFFKNNMSFVEIRPALNGIILLFDRSPSSGPAKIKLQVDRRFESLQSNNKYFSIMREKLIPFITASCIGTINTREKVSASCQVYSQKVNDFEYILTFDSTNKSASRIAVEINMHEPKLFHDTTVESKNPTMNNAFGGISFLGTSKSFGEQLLYSRLEVSNIAHLRNKKIMKSILHIPQLSYNAPPIAVNKISQRFCSFGSNWENKIDIKDTIAVSYASNGYYHIDMTKFLGNLNTPQNFVIIAPKNNKPAIISTGDSFYAPQILEVQYQ